MYLKFGESRKAEGESPKCQAERNNGDYSSNGEVAEASVETECRGTKPEML